MKELIIEAIRKRSLLELRYHGFRRLVEPHLLGETMAGHLALRCYQVGGGSESGERQGWKLLLLSEIVQAHPMKEGFASARPGYNPHDKQMSRILARL